MLFRDGGSARMYVFSLCDMRGWAEPCRSAPDKMPGALIQALLPADRAQSMEYFHESNLAIIVTV